MVQQRKAKRVRWQCPECERAVLAPTRLAADDVRRYCLPCSTKCGRLVRRSAPALEAKRQRSRAAQQDKAKRQRARRRQVVELRGAQRAAAEAAAYHCQGVDLRREVERLWNLPYLKAQRERWYRQRSAAPTFDWHANRKRGAYATASVYTNGVEFYTGPDLPRTLGVLLHELVHCSLPGSVHHGDLFWTVLHGAARQAWPDAPFRFDRDNGRGSINDRQWFVTDGLQRRTVHADEGAAG